MGSESEKQHGPGYILTGSAYLLVAASGDSALNQAGDDSNELNRTLEFNSQSIPGKTMKSRVKN